MEIIGLERKYAHIVKDMMRTFYASPCVKTNGSEKIFSADIEACLGDCPYLEGYVFRENEQIVGYAMLAKSFSTEFGMPCVWIEDLYFKPEYRRMGYGSAFFAFVEKQYPSAAIRLEAEADNRPAVAAYQKNGFVTIDYLEMIKPQYNKTPS